MVYRANTFCPLHLGIFKYEFGSESHTTVFYSHLDLPTLYLYGTYYYICDLFNNSTLCMKKEEESKPKKMQT